MDVSDIALVRINEREKKTNRESNVTYGRNDLRLSCRFISGDQ
jgi:hypothetical protein